MKTFIFTDMLTNESFEVKCFPFEVHSIERTNKALGEWCVGRIINRVELD